MKLRTALVACIALGVLAWGISTLRERAGSQAGLALAVDCPLPPQVGPDAPPLQSEVPDAMPTLAAGETMLEPLAGFSVEARVLSREDYRLGREAGLSPTDLALGWQRMREDAVVSQLQISQSSRWYHYRWKQQPPLPQREIASSSANMHMIPANDAVADLLSEIGTGDRVRIDGWLVEARSPDGWRWRSSTTRTDTGGGACELVSCVRSRGFERVAMRLYAHPAVGCSTTCGTLTLCTSSCAINLVACRY